MATIIDFTARRQKPTSVASTAENEKLRAARRKAWEKADATTSYWRALLGFTHAVEIGKRHNVEAACAHANINLEAREASLESLRTALIRQFFTPAPDMTAVRWKCRESSQISWH